MELKNNIMANFYNIDPETCSLAELHDAIDKCEEMENYYYCMEQGCKRFINSVYGAIGCQYYQCYNTDIAESITLQGQDLIKFSVRCINKLFKEKWHTQYDIHKKISSDMKNIFPEFNIEAFLENAKIPTNFGETAQVYGDTDSAYITLDPIIKSCGISNEETTDFILLFNKHLLSDYLNYCFEVYAKSYNCKSNIEEFELEKIARSVLMLAKKHYIMDIAWKEPDVRIEPLQSMVYKGVEIVQGTSSLFCREEQKKFALYLIDCINKDKAVQYGELISFLKEIKRKFAVQNPNDISINRSISDYDKFVLDDKNPHGVVYRENITVPFHVRAASVYNNRLYNRGKIYKTKYEFIHKGDKMKIYYTKGCNADESVFAYIPGNYPMEFAPQIDIDTQFEKLMLNPLNRYIVSMGYPPVSSSLTYATQLW